MPAPEWALLQRELLRAHTEAYEIFHAKYFDARNHLLCFPRWGTNDGPDDAIEHVNDWPLVHALGGSDRILELYRAVYEGHLEQYGALRTKSISSVSNVQRSLVVSGRSFDVKLGAGCGARLTLAMRRYSATPTLAFPWVLNYASV